MFQGRKFENRYERQRERSSDLHRVTSNQMHICDLRSGCYHILDTVKDETKLIAYAVKITNDVNVGIVRFDNNNNIYNMKRCQL